MDVEQRARELLAQAFDARGQAESANALRAMTPLAEMEVGFEASVSALFAALTPPEGFVLVPVDVQKDAQRYRWLRDSAPEEWDVTRWLDNGTQELHVQDYLNEAIDATMIATRPEVKA